MPFLVLKMTTNSGASCSVDVLAKVFTPAGSNPNGFKGLRGLHYTGPQVFPYTRSDQTFNQELDSRACKDL